MNKKSKHLCLLSLFSGFLSYRVASNQVLSTFVSLTTVFGMGTGVSSQLSPLFLRVFSQNYIEEFFICVFSKCFS